MWQWAMEHPYIFTFLVIIAIVGVILTFDEAVKYHYEINKIKWYQKNFMDDHEKPSLIKGGKNPPPSGPRPNFTPPPTIKRED